MKIVMTLLVRDEADIVRANIEYHLSQGVDFIVATDNLSADGTLDVLAGFQARGLLHLLREPADDYNQTEWVTRMARLSSTQFGADWVINNDADEFWWPRHGDLKAALAAVPDHCSAVAVKRYDFIPRPVPEGPLFTRMVVKVTDPRNALGHPLPPKVCHRGMPDVVVAQGNHRLLFPPDVRVLPATDVEIFHFPLRTYEQFENKIRKGGAAYERNTSVGPNVGGTWRKLYEDFKKDHLDGYFHEQLLSQADIAKGISEGRLAVDTRLVDYMQRSAIDVLSTRTSTTRADGRKAGRSVGG